MKFKKGDIIRKYGVPFICTHADEQMADFKQILGYNADQFILADGTHDAKGGVNFSTPNKSDHYYYDEFVGHDTLTGDMIFDNDDYHLNEYGVYKTE